MANISRSRKSGFVLRGGSMRRETLWFGHTFTDTTITAAGGTILTSANAALLALRPFTIVRTRLESFVRSDQAAAAEVFIGAYGQCIVSDQASAIGVSAVPTPVTDLSSDLWFVHQPFAGVFESGTGTNNGWRYEIDSKAMRKVQEGEDLVTVVEFSALGSGFNFFVGGRALVKLH